MQELVVRQIERQSRCRALVEPGEEAEQVASLGPGDGQVTAVVAEMEGLHITFDERLGGSTGRQVQAIDDGQRYPVRMVDRVLQRDLGTGVETVHRAPLDAERGARLGQCRGERRNFGARCRRQRRRQPVARGVDGDRRELAGERSQHRRVHDRRARRVVQQQHRWTVPGIPVMHLAVRDVDETPTDLDI